MGIIAMGMGDGHKGFSGPRWGAVGAVGTVGAVGADPPHIPGGRQVRPRTSQGPATAFSHRTTRTVALKYVHVQYAKESELGADALHGRA